MSGKKTRSRCKIRGKLYEKSFFHYPKRGCIICKDTLVHNTYCLRLSRLVRAAKCCNMISRNIARCNILLVLIRLGGLPRNDREQSPRRPFANCSTYFGEKSNKQARLPSMHIARIIVQYLVMVVIGKRAKMPLCVDSFASVSFLSPNFYPRSQKC